MRRAQSYSNPDENTADPPEDVELWRAAIGLFAPESALDAQAIAEKTRLFFAIAHWGMLGRAVAGITILVTLGASVPVMAVLTMLFALDGGFALLIRKPLLTDAHPRTQVLVVTAYGLLAGLGWAATLLLLPPGQDMLGAAALVCGGVATFYAIGALPLAAIAFGVPVLLAATMEVGRLDFAVLLAATLVTMFGVMLSVARRTHLTHRRRLSNERSVRKASNLLAEFEENRRGWFWEIDVKGNLTYISPQLAEAIGRTAADLLGKPFTDLLMSEDQDAAQPRTERTLGFHLSTRLAFTDVAVRAAVRGETRWWSLSGRPAFDEFGNYLGFRGNGTDLTEMRRSEAEVTRLARYDALTGLPNRTLMHDTLDASLRDAAERHKPCALLLIDLDRFKSVNDTLGHPVGDALLRQVGDRLQGAIGTDGQVGRLGGDEFKVVLPGIFDRSRLANIADKVIDRLSMPYLLEDSHHVSIGASIGIAIAPEDGAAADSLVRNADLALYAAKGAGKGVHRFYQREMHTFAKDRALLEADLRKALSEGALELVYQPVVNTTTELISGFEALARWMHPTRGEVSPSIFIPIAEEIGLIPQIGEWVIRTACMEAARWPDPVRVAVNISPIQFANPSLPTIVMSALAAAQLPAQRLELEITEGVFLNDGDATDAMFARLKAIGVRFALDDFGTGYSSLGYLKKAPFNKIKIDQGFVRGAAAKDSRNAAIIKAIVTLAESLDMETTAEGAETHDELELIRSLGCSHIQGYIFGRPMRLEEALERVSGNAPLIAEGFVNSRAPRVAVLRSATLKVEGRTLACRVRNLSCSGAMVEADAAMVPGARVEVVFPDGNAYAGLVRWSQDGRFGMAFDYPFDLEQLNAQKSTIKRAKRA